MRRGWRAVGLLALAWPWMACSATVQQSSTEQHPSAQPTPAKQQPAEQPPPAQQQTPPPAQTKPRIETPSMRLASARNVMIVRTHGGQIPFETIRSTVEGWGRFTLVETQDKADLIIEVASSGDSGVQVATSSAVSPDTGKEENSSSTRKDLSPTQVNMMVFDARNKRPLWSGTESVKFAMKEKSKENNLVEAAERLAAKFHQRLDPAASAR